MILVDVFLYKDKSKISLKQNTKSLPWKKNTNIFIQNLIELQGLISLNEKSYQGLVK